MFTSTSFTFGKPQQRILKALFGFIFLLSIHANAQTTNAQTAAPQQPLGLQLVPTIYGGGGITLSAMVVQMGA